MGDVEYIQAFNKIVMPIAHEFSPDLVFSECFLKKRYYPILNNLNFIVSAGYDAAMNDPLGENLLTPMGYSHMTHMLSSLANGKLVVALEVSIYIGHNLF